MTTLLGTVMKLFNSLYLQFTYLSRLLFFVRYIVLF